MLSKRDLLSAGAALGLGALVAGRAAAQTAPYPSRPIKIIIPFGPGGPTEFILRLIADRLTATLGQAVVVENRPGGAGGTVGAKSVAVAEPDGYTLLFSSPGPLVTAAAIYKNLDYDPIKSFAPIAMVIYAPQMLAVHPSLAVNRCRSSSPTRRATRARSRSDRPGTARSRTCSATMLKVTAGIDIVHVPYRGAGRSVTDVLAGQVQMIFETTAILLPHIQGGKSRPLAMAAEVRSPLLPDVPTTVESGYPKLLASFWSGLLAPAGTPASIVDKLNGAVNDILRSKEAQDGLARLSAESRIGSPQDFAAFIAVEAPRWAAIAAETGIKVD